jgi:hypothetical protein
MRPKGGGRWFARFCVRTGCSQSTSAGVHPHLRRRPKNLRMSRAAPRDVLVCKDALIMPLILRTGGSNLGGRTASSIISVAGEITAANARRSLMLNTNASVLVYPIVLEHLLLFACALARVTQAAAPVLLVRERVSRDKTNTECSF